MKHLGNQDYSRLYPIYRHATDISKIHDLKFHFDIDSGNHETSIVFNLETKSCRKRNEYEEWDDIRYPELMITPDVCDFEGRIIFEFEEETGNRKSGAHHARKGHGHEGDPDKKRDTRRNECYKNAGFTLHRIWESQFKKSIWQIPVTEFLINCYRKNLMDSMTFYEKIPNLE